jgi:IstB-like ATP binding protein
VPPPPNSSTRSPRPPTPGRLSRVVARYRRVDLLCLHELGYQELNRRGSEPLFQITTERDERSAIATASSEPFSKAHMFAATCASQRCSTCQLAGCSGTGLGHLPNRTVLAAVSTSSERRFRTPSRDVIIPDKPGASERPSRP